MTASEILARLVAYPTIAGTSNLALIDYLETFLRERGVTVRRFPNAAGDRAALFASIGPSGHDGIVLSGHTDVVTPERQNWTQDPFTLVERDGQLFGRGTADMKGFLACVLASVDAMMAAPLRQPIHLAFSFDEELGCLGIKPMLEILSAEGFKAATCIVGEPTLLQVATAHKGKTALVCRCRGVAAHSAMIDDGVNAIYLANDMIMAIRALQKRINDRGTRDSDYSVPVTTLHVGTISGGMALNIVPEAAQFQFEIRNLPFDDPAVLVAELQATAEAIAVPYRQRFPQVGIELEVVNQYPALGRRDDPALATLVGSWSGVSATTKVAYGTEAGYFEQVLGVPTVVCGPGSMAQGHQPDEFIATAQIDAGCRFILAIIAHQSS